MQKTRQKILEYLRHHEEATVDDLSDVLDNLTAVTVRHHLDVLRGQGLVSSPEVQHRNTPGRPKYVYSLTEKAHALFPRNLNTLSTHLIAELTNHLEDDRVNVIMDGVAERMASELPPGPPNETFDARLDRVVRHLTEHGYEASWTAHPDGYVLSTSNCPYGDVATDHEEQMCMLDMRYLSRLIGAVPRRLDYIPDGDNNCSYLIHSNQIDLVISN